MRLQVEADAIKGVVGVASLPIRRMHIPILECLHIIADGGRVRAIGSCHEIEAQAICEAAVSDHGSANVNAADLARALRAASGVIRMNAADGYLRIQHDKADISLPVLDQDFPRMPKPEQEEEIEGIEAAIHGLPAFISNEEVRHYLTGICLDDGNAVATNGKRLARFGVSGGKGQIIPGNAVPIIKKFAGSDFRMFVGDRVWRAEAEGRATMGKLVDGQFPDWRRIVVPHRPVCSFDADEMLAAIDRATLGKARDVFIRMSDGAAKLSGEAWPSTEIKTETTVRCDDGDMDFRCIAADLVNCLKPFSGSVVDISVSDYAYRFSPAESPENLTMVAFVNDPRNRLPLQKVAA